MKEIQGRKEGKNRQTGEVPVPGMERSVYGLKKKGI